MCFKGHCDFNGADAGWRAPTQNAGLRFFRSLTKVGEMIETGARKVMPQRLREFIAAVLRAERLPDDDAETVASLMVEADLLGGDGHGVFRLPQYLNRLRAGGFNARPNIRIERERGATAVVNGDNGFGHLVMKRCAEEAIARARQYGIGWVGAHHSNHAGVAGVYAMMPLAHNMMTSCWPTRALW